MFRKVPVTEIGHSNALGGATWPYFDSTYTNAATLAPNLSLGMVFNLSGDISEGGGNTFMVVKAFENLTAGIFVTATAAAQGQFPTTVGGTVTATGSTTSIIKTNITTLAQDVTGPLMMYIANSTSSGGGFVLRPAKLISNGAATAPYGTNSFFEIAKADYTIPVSPAGPNALALVATNADVCGIIRPYNVGICGAANVPTGLTLQATTGGNYTIVQVAGEGMAMSLVTTPALVAMEQAKVAAGGVITGTGAVGTQPWIAGGCIIPHFSFTGGTSSLQPISFNLTGNL